MKSIKRRPMAILFVLIVLGILSYNQVVPGTNTYQKVCKDSTITGTVYDVVPKGDATALLVDTGKENILVYESYNKDLFSTLKLGQTIILKGELNSFSKPGNPGQFNEYEYYKQLNISYRMYADELSIVQKEYNHIRQFFCDARNYLMKMIQKNMPERESALLGQMILGDRSLMTDEIKDEYQSLSLVHLLVVSGLHISLLTGCVFLLLRRKILSMQMAAIISLCFALCYGALTGFSLAATRAVIMMCCMFGAKLCGRVYDAISGLCLAGLILVVSNPGCLYQSGFLFSFGTVAGILLLEPWMEHILLGPWITNPHIKWWQQSLAKAVVANASITIFTLPVVCYFYYEISVYSIVANLLVLPIVPVLVGCGLSGTLACVIMPGLGRFILGTSYVFLHYIDGVIGNLTTLPMQHVLSGRVKMQQCVLYYVCMYLVVWLTGKFCKKRIAVLLGILPLIFFLKGENISFEYTQLDVGQGDCAFFTSNGKNCLVDCGSSSTDKVGRYRIKPFLKYKRVESLDLVILTHSDSDHINGAIELMKNTIWDIPIQQIIVPAIDNPDENYCELIELCKRNKVKVTYMDRGDRLQVGGIAISCLHPTPHYSWEKENDYSLVLLMEYASFRVLMTGDAEAVVEESLPKVGRVDVLKVGHHGSKNGTSTEFLADIKPRYAIISAGENNRYGHPHPDTLERLKEAECTILSTIDSGAIKFALVGEKVQRFG